MAPSGITPDTKPSPVRLGLAATAMMVCLAIAIISAAEALIPGWSGAHVLMGIVIAAIEALYSFHVLHLPRSRGISIPRYRLAEVCLLGLVLKLVSYYGRPWADIQSDVLAMMWQPSAFFSGDYVILLVTAWIAWMIINRSMGDFEALHDPYLSHAEQHDPREKLISRFYWGGGLLVLFVGLRYFAADASLTDQIWPGRVNAPPTGGYHLHALLYFLLGTVLLSQIRLTSLMTGWRLQNIAIADGMGKTWLRYGLVFLIVVILLVAILPTHYSMGLFDTALLGLKVLIALAGRLMELLILAIILPLSWLLGLFGHGEGGALPLPPLPDTPAPEPGQRSEPLLPWEVIRSLLFWLTFFVVAIYLIRSYLEDHPEFIEVLKKLTFARRMVEVLAALIALLAAWVEKSRQWRPMLVGRWAAAAETKRPKAKTRRRWHALRARSNREQVIYAYLQMLQHAAAAGMHRRQHQTPYEYAPHLHHALPDAESDINALTDMFVRVRYRPEPVGPDHAAKAITHGESIRRALLQLRHRDDTNG